MKRKRTADKSTSTSDPVIEDDHVQVKKKPSLTFQASQGPEYCKGTKLSIFIYYLYPK